MRIELDSWTETITVDGVIISLELLRNLAKPDPTKAYRMIRRGDIVTVETIRLTGPEPIDGY